MATTTIYTDTTDGYVASNNTTYTTARSGSNLFSDDATEMSIGQANIVGTSYCWEAFLAFDTSSIGTVPYGASTAVYMYSDQSDIDFILEVRATDWGAAVTTADFVAGASLGGLTLVAQSDTTAWTNNSYNTLGEVGTAFRNAIVLGGTTRLLLHSSRHRLGTAPATDTNEKVNIENAENAGTTLDAKLVLVTAADASVDEILNPNIDVTINSWTTDTGGTTSLYAAIDETTASDTDYIQSPAGPTSAQYYETALETHADPVSSSGHIVHYRYQKNVAGGNVDLTTSLQGPSSNGLSANQNGLETDTTGWTATSNCSIARSTAQFYAGTASLAVTGTNNSSSVVSTPGGTSGIPVTGAGTVTVSCRARAETTGRNTGVGITQYDASGTVIGADPLRTALVADSSSGWTNPSDTGTLDPAARFIKVTLRVTSHATSEVHYFDDIIFSDTDAVPVELASWTHTNIPSTWTQQDQTLTAPQADSITDYSDLRLRFTPNMVTTDAVVPVPTLVADRATANSNTAVTTVDLVLTGMTVGNYLFIRTAADNSGGGGGARTISVSNQSGTPINLTLDNQQQANNDPGAASAGVTVNLIVAKITATSGTVRLTYSGSVVQACVAEEWSGLDPTQAHIGTGGGGGANVNTTALPTQTDPGVAVGNLIYVAFAVEGPGSDTYTVPTDTTGGSWIALTKLGTSDATADLNQTIYGAYKVPTAAGAQPTSGATVSTARDSALWLCEFLAAPIPSPTIKTQVSWANLELPSSSVAHLVGANVGVLLPSTGPTLFGASDSG